MSNQSADGSWGSAPLITDKELERLSLAEIQNIVEKEKEGLKKDYSELSQRKRLIKQYKKLVKAREKVNKGIDIKKERKKKEKKKKTFDDYFQEYIKNKNIPDDTPSYLREALERAKLEYDQGLVKEKSALENFAVKYIIEGEPGLTPVEFFNRFYKTLENFFTYHRNIKSNMILISLMEQQLLSKDKGVVGLKEDKAYFTTGININLKSTKVKKNI